MDQIEIRHLTVGEDCASNTGNVTKVNTFIHRQHTEVNSTYQEQCFLFIVGAGRSARGDVACFASICPKKRIHVNQRQDIQSIQNWLNCTLFYPVMTN